MEIILILIIVILVYLLLKKNNNKTVEGLEKKADVYGNAFKKAASTFKESIKNTNNDLNQNENKSDEVINEELSKIHKNMEENKDESYSKVQKLIHKFLIGQIEEAFISNTLSFEKFRERVVDDYSLACIGATVTAFLQDLKILDIDEEEMKNSELRLHSITFVSIMEVLIHTYERFNKDHVSDKEEINRIAIEAMNRIYDLSPTDKTFNKINTEMGKQVFEFIHNPDNSKVPNIWLKNLHNV